MQQSRPTLTLTLAGLMLSALLAAPVQAQSSPLLPLKYSGPATVPAITAGDLMTRLYIYADDSMMGRDVGSIYHLKATAYIERELRKMGLKPGGDNGSFFQDFPLWHTKVDAASSLMANGRSFTFATDFIPAPNLVAPTFNNVPVIFAGYWTDTTTILDTMAVVGKVLVYPSIIAPLVTDSVARAAYLAAQRSTAYRVYQRAAALAAGRIQVYGDSIPAAIIRQFTTPSASMTEPAPPPANAPNTAIGVTLITNTTASALFGGQLANLKKGQVGGLITLNGKYSTVKDIPGRNVVAILPGSDPKLAGQYVAMGAHSDHVGFQPLTVRNEHDSLRLYNMIGRPAGAEGGRSFTTNPITPAEWAKLNADIAELRKSYPPRPDSIFNGADDDGSGSVSLLEIAEAFAKGPVKPKRSMLFIWQAGEERGMWGSGYFMDHPTVPRDSIVTQLNIDMVGRGAASDVTGQAKAPQGAVVGDILHGGDRYVQLVGSRRLSTELGDLVEKVNTDKKHGFTFDYNIDADGHQQNIYCRSDHWSYAKWGVPVVFFTTGGHADYHQVTDEPQYIRYDHMSMVNKLIFDVAMSVGNLDHRPVVDKAKPNPAPATACRQ